MSKQAGSLEEFDVVVLGPGAAGLTAAITAHEHGASVVVVDKPDRIDGTTAWSSGMVCLMSTAAPSGPEVDYGRTTLPLRA